MLSTAELAWLDHVAEQRGGITRSDVIRQELHKEAERMGLKAKSDS